MHVDTRTPADLVAEISPLQQKIAERKRSGSRGEKTAHPVQEHEEPYRFMFENAGEGIIIVQGDSIRLANPASARIIGHSLDIITGRPFVSFVHRDDRAMIVERYLRRLRGEPAETGYDFRIIAADGTERWVHITSRVIDWEGMSASLSFIIDITRSKLAESQLEATLEDFQRTEERYQNILNTMQEAYYEVDLKGNFTFFNLTAAVNLGYSRDDLMGINFRDIAGEDASNLVKTFNQVYRTGEQISGIDWVIQTKDGRKFPVETSVSLKRDAHENPIGFKGVTRDITERKKAEDQLRYMGIHDPLTGVHNRHMFDEELRRLGTGRFDPVGIVICDLDGLKLVNDTLGHDTGDRQIIAAANLIRQQFRSSDIVARIGGDEFAVLLQSCPPEIIETICGRLKKAMGALVPDTNIPLMMSIGYATREGNNRPIAKVFTEADGNMYREKDRNRDLFRKRFERLMPQH